MDNRLDMAGSIQEIAQRLTALDQKIETMGDTFTETYRSYLQQLGQTVRQQLILSCYKICTENYPKRFLALPLSQRQQLQDDLKALADQTATDLQELLQPIEHTQPEPVELPDELAALLSDEDLDDEDDEYQEELEPKTPLTPIEALTIWQEQLDRSIHKTLKTASNRANQYLQDAEILQKRIPQAVIDAASKSEGNDPNSPNLLNVLVSASEKSGTDGTPAAAAAALNALIHVVAVNLKLNELEFNDIPLMNLRNKIRDLKKQFQVIAREYQKKQREHAVLEAQHAWKSTWT
ncbi:hypothetical protein [Leptolyngbya sp. GGD]|uniref:hypothetical protein n=1 Tax=Leptolyngbya sp. GGD TaxID=2997907 RepID=UPI00227CC13F|nr:hypothetical protein [Leptolyngbya sp. GGD]MCY6491417.1 hypothetical protein [Leptolyngbya sp. GGD]